MAAAAVSTLACPLRRSTRLAHAHSHPHHHPNTHPRQHHHHRIKSHHSQRPTPDPDPDQDSSSSDPENELTPRALRALKRQRLALDPDGLPFAARSRPRKRRKQSFSPVDTAQLSHTPHLTKRPSCSLSTDSNTLENDRRPSMPRPVPELSVPLPESPSEPLTPLTPLTPSPQPSPSLPGHDRQVLPPSPPASLDTLPTPEPPPAALPQTDSFPPPPPPVPLDPALDTLIPFEGLHHPPFASGLSVQIPTPSCQSPTPPQIQGLELQEQFHSFPQPQLYVPPNPVFVRDREINIWKLACQERVDCLLRRYGVDYIKALVESEARSLSSTATQLGPSQTKFRLYTPASYTYSSTAWGATPGTRKSFPFDDEGDDVDPAWPMDDADWVDADVDMEDEDEDDYEDDEDAGDAEAEREGEATLEAVEALVITETPTHSVSRVDSQATVAMPVDNVPGKSEMMQVDEPRLTTNPTLPESSPRPLTPVPYAYTSPPSLTPPTLPPLSSLHVPLLSEPPRAFMGRGTPPDRQRLVEWSGSGRFAANGMGPPLYLSPAPQRHASSDVGIVPMSVDSSMHPAPSQSPPHTHGEWTSFLYSMLEGDGVGPSVGDASHTSEPTWYELGLGAVPAVVSENALELPLTHSHPHIHGRTPTADHPVEEGKNSSSTLRFALG